MIKNYLKKAIVLATITTLIMVLNPIGASAKWEFDRNGYWYTEGDSYATGWRFIDGYWYYFHSNGYKARGWQKLDEKWYYFDRDGTMVANGLVGGYYVGENGAWVEDYNVYAKNRENINNLSTINTIINLKRNEIVNFLGINYERVDAGAEGIMKAYHYKEGLTIVFCDGEDSDKVAWIECDKNVDINGAKDGMNFDQIQKQLGIGNMKDYDTFIDAYKTHMYELNYIIKDCKLEFMSTYKDGQNSKVYIFHK